MEFEVKKVCCCTNLERDLYNVSVGDFVYVADSLTELKRLVEKNDVSEAMKLREIQEGKGYPFGVKFDDILNNCFYAFAYKCEDKKPVDKEKVLNKVLNFVQEFRSNWIVWENKNTGSIRYSFIKSVSFNNDNDDEISISFTDYPSKMTLTDILSKDCNNVYISLENHLDVITQEKRKLGDALREWLGEDCPKI